MVDYAFLLRMIIIIKWPIENGYQYHDTPILDK